MANNNGKLSFDEAVDRLNKREDLSDEQKDSVYAKMEATRDSSDNTDSVDWSEFLSTNVPTIDERISATVNRDHDVSPMFSVAHTKNNPEMLFPKSDKYWRKWDDNVKADAAIRFGFLPADLRWPTGNKEHDRIREEQIRAFMDAASKYEIQLQKDAAEYNRKMAKKAISEDMSKNTGDILSPRESWKNFWDSNDKLGFIQNTVNANLFPTAYRLTREVLNGNDTITDDDIKRAVLIDIGLNVATAPLGGEIAGLKALRGPAGLRTKFGELVGDATSGALAGGAQEGIAQSMVGDGYDIGDIGLSTMFGAGGNAATKAAGIVGTGSLGAISGIRGGNMKTRLKGATDFMNDIAYTDEAILGSKLDNGVKSTGDGYASTRKELDATSNAYSNYNRRMDLFNQTLGDDPQFDWGNTLIQDAEKAVSESNDRVDRIIDKGGRLDKNGNETQKYLNAVGEYNEAVNNLNNVKEFVSRLPDSETYSRMSPTERDNLIQELVGKYGTFALPEGARDLTTPNNMRAGGVLQGSATFENVAPQLDAGNAWGDWLDTKRTIQQVEDIKAGKPETAIFGVPLKELDAGAANDLVITEMKKNPELTRFGAEFNAGTKSAQAGYDLVNTMFPEIKETFGSIYSPEWFRPNPAPIINMVTGIVERAKNDVVSDEELQQKRWERGDYYPTEESEYQSWRNEEEAKRRRQELAKKKEDWKKGINIPMPGTADREIFDRWNIDNIKLLGAI